MLVFIIGSSFLIYLASIALTSTCRHRTVIRTSDPKAINFDLKRLANLQNKLKYKIFMKSYYYISNIRTKNLFT